MIVAEFPQPLQKALQRRHAAHIARHRLQNYRGDAVGLFGKQGFYRLKIIIGGQQGIGGGGGGDPRRRGDAQGGGPGSGGHVGARVDQPHHLHRRHQIDDLLGKAHLGIGRRAEGGTQGHGVGKGLGYFRMGVADDHRSPGAHIVDIGAPIDIGHHGAARLADKRRRAAHRLEGPHRTVDPAGNQFLGAFEERFRLGHSGDLRGFFYRCKSPYDLSTPS